MQQTMYGKGIDLTGLLGGIKGDWRSGGRKSPSGVQGQSPGRGSLSHSDQRPVMYGINNMEHKVT